MIFFRCGMQFADWFAGSKFGDNAIFMVIPGNIADVYNVIKTWKNVVLLLGVKSSTCTN